MPSSISSSEAPPVTDKVRADVKTSHLSIWLILAGICLIGAASEAVTMFGLHRVSKIIRRTDQEYRDSLALPTYSATNTPTMLLLGNSLLLEGVDLASLRTTVAGKYDVHRLVFEQTEYLDLY